MSLQNRVITFVALAGLLCSSALKAEEKLSPLQIHVDDARGEALPCRIHLFDSSGKAMTAPGQPFWRDHFSCLGRVTLPLAPGRYRYEIERGPEHLRLAGTVEVKAGRDHTLHVALPRIADLKKQGWYSGDLHVHRPVQEIEVLMRAEDLHVAPVITWWNQRNAWTGQERPRQVLHQIDGDRYYHVMAGEDERGGGALLFFHLDEPLPFGKKSREFPPATTFVEAARKRNRNVWIDIEKPFWWDVPVWLASGQTDSIGIANNHMWRRGALANEAWGRARDERRFPGPQGNGRWTQEIYYHILNCGLRLPPSAGSASGVLPNPVGYNRVYAHVEGPFSYEKWWASLKQGRCFVTNGPLLLVRANDRLPGATFRSEDGKPLQITLDLSIISNDPVREVEVIENGRVVQRIGEDGAGWQGPRATLTVRESGWFLLRAIADTKDTLRFASTAPFYVEVGQPRRISKSSARFFEDWVAERIARLQRDLPPGPERDEVLKIQRQAALFWKGLAEKATAE